MGRDEQQGQTRREVGKLGLFALPVILSMGATPAFAQRGSHGHRRGPEASEGQQAPVSGSAAG
jgi:hypothetical protein